MVIITFSLAGCAAFETRMQPLDDYDYLDATTVDKYHTDNHTNDESRNNYDLPELTSLQEENGYLSPNIDIRPPTQLLSVIDGIFLDPSETQKTKVLFNELDVSDNMSTKIWNLLDEYLDQFNVDFVSKNQSLLQLETTPFIQKIKLGSGLTSHTVVKESS